MYDQISENGFNTIFENFQICKIKMLKLLLEAYNDFSYNKIKKVYNEYIIFDYKNFTVISNNVENIHDVENSFKILTNIIEKSGEEYFIYLSCNLPSEFKFQRFEMTRILISYLGHRENSDLFKNSIQMITHDLESPHHQYNRKISYTDDELLKLRTFLNLLYEYFKSDKQLLEKIINYIHNHNYDVDVSKLTIVKLINQNANTIIIYKSYIINIIEKYINEYKNLPQYIKTDAIVKLLYDDNIIIRLTGITKTLLKMKLTILNEDEKNLIIECLQKVMENESLREIDILLNEIKIFMDDSRYIININKILTPQQIIFLKFCIKHKFDNHDFTVNYEFLKFLYIHYPELFNNIVYNNMTNLINTVI